MHRDAVQGGTEHIHQCAAFTLNSGHHSTLIILTSTYEEFTSLHAAEKDFKTRNHVAIKMTSHDEAIGLISNENKTLFRFFFHLRTGQRQTNPACRQTLYRGQ